MAAFPPVEVVEGSSPRQTAGSPCIEKSDVSVDTMWVIPRVIGVAGRWLAWNERMRGRPHGATPLVSVVHSPEHLSASDRHRRGDRALLGADVLEQHAAVRQALLGQAVARFRRRL